MKVIFKRNDEDPSVFEKAKHYNETMDIMIDKLSSMEKDMNKFKRTFWEDIEPFISPEEEYDEWKIAINDDEVTFTAGNKTSKDTVDVFKDFGSKMMEVVIGGVLNKMSKEQLSDYFKTVDCNTCAGNNRCPIQDRGTNLGINWKELQA